jgi:hypothetical protein
LKAANSAFKAENQPLKAAYSAFRVENLPKAIFAALKSCLSALKAD